MATPLGEKERRELRLRQESSAIGTVTRLITYGGFRQEHVGDDIEGIRVANSAA